MIDDATIADIKSEHGQKKAPEFKQMPLPFKKICDGAGYTPLPDNMFEPMRIHTSKDGVNHPLSKDSVPPTERVTGAGELSPTGFIQTNHCHAMLHCSEVYVSQCKRCGLKEHALTTNCCGYRLTAEEENQIANGHIDYTEKGWVKTHETSINRSNDN
jgi:hypothetical protein